MKHKKENKKNNLVFKESMIRKMPDESAKQNLPERRNIFQIRMLILHVQSLILRQAARHLNESNIRKRKNKNQN